MAAPVRRTLLLALSLAVLAQPAVPAAAAPAPRAAPPVAARPAHVDGPAAAAARAIWENAKQKSGETSDQSIAAAANLANALIAEDDIPDGVDLLLHMRGLIVARSGPDAPEVLVITSAVAMTLINSGDPVRGEAMARDALARAIRTRGENDLVTTLVKAGLGTALSLRGSYNEAYPLVLAGYEGMSAAYGPGSEQARQIGLVLQNITLALGYDAESLAIRRRMAATPAAGAPETVVLMAAFQRVTLLNNEEHYREALTAADALVRRLTKLRGPDHTSTLDATAQLAAAYAGLERWDDAADLVGKVRDGYARVRGPEDLMTLRYAETQGLYLTRSPDLSHRATGRAMMIKVIETRRRVQGEHAAQVVQAEVVLGMSSLNEEEGDPGKAMEAAFDWLQTADRDMAADPTQAASRNALAVNVLIGMQLINQTHKYPAQAWDRLSRAAATVRARSADRRVATTGLDSMAELTRNRYIFTGQIRAGWMLAAETPPGPRRDQLREESWEAAQGAVVSAAADAMSGVAARFGQGGGELAQLVARREQQQTDLTALRRRIEMAGQSAGAGLEAIAARNQAKALRDQEQALALQLDETSAALDQKYPAYAELTRPRPESAAATQALLGPDEALLLMTPEVDGTYIWVVTHDRFDWVRSSLTETQVTEAVRTLRAALDPSSGQAAAPFDRAIAYKLYENLIAPLESRFRDKKVLFVAATGALQSLPLSVLVTQDPKLAKPNQGEWLIDRYALATLPAVSSLRTLRCLSPHPGAGIHKGCEGAAPATPRAAGATLAYVGLGAPVLGGDPGASRGGLLDWKAYADGLLADPDKLRSLSPLPGARAEIDALAGLFGRRAAFTRTSDQFTETLVKTSPEVKSARVLHFATHALMGGESNGGGEPGLVLTPPAENAASALDDGLLTASEAAALDINAEFVVLSACNTARADGTLGADGLSGLARGFFYAGAHSMLVSHWSVDDASTKALMVDLFQGVEDHRLDRATALQRAIQKVKRDPAFADPRFWAPFVLVGDTGN